MNDDDSTVIELGPEDSKFLLDLISRSSEPNEKLKKAAGRCLDLIKEEEPTKDD